MVELESHNWQKLPRASWANNECINYWGLPGILSVEFVEEAVLLYQPWVFSCHMLHVTCLEYDFELVYSYHVLANYTNKSVKSVYAHQLSLHLSAAVAKEQSEPAEKDNTLFFSFRVNRGALLS